MYKIKLKTLNRYFISFIKYTYKILKEPKKNRNSKKKKIESIKHKKRPNL